MRRALRAGGAAVLAMPLLLLQGQGPTTEEYPAPPIRERQQIVVGDARETWELRWKAPPVPACGPSDTSLTCPCTGFAYGEGGALELVRFRGGEEIDRLDLTPFFKDADVNVGDIAVLPRWAPDYESDYKLAERDGLAETVIRRHTVKAMNFVDYDRNGEKSEFFLQTDTLPCGKSAGVVIGLSTAELHLHAFGSASTPSKPLALQKHIWDALSRSQGPTEVVSWRCGDHGADEETTVRLENTTQGIVGAWRTYSCPRTPGQRPMREEPL